MFRKKRLSFVLILLTCLFFFATAISSEPAQGKDDVVVSLGKDLNQDQKKEILEIFGVKDDVKIIYVTNQEEREYLSGYIKDEIIGTKAISSSYVKILEENQGIDIETYNINWVTKEMYTNALVTAGVKDARVKVAAPVNVSGTAALTGIIKAFEDATGSKLEENKKKVANEEIAKTGKLGEDIGKEKASRLIREVKDKIISGKVKDESDIREIVIEITGELNIKLNEQQTEEVVSLMKNISKLNLNVKEIENQLQGITKKIDKIAEDNKEVKSFFQRILDFIRQVFASILTLLEDML